MRLGLTFDLKDDYRRLGFSEEEVAEFESAETIDGLEAALRRLGHTTERIGGIHQLSGRLVRGDRWDLVFNIAEGLYGFGREAQVPALLDAFRIPYTFSDPLTLALCLHKGMVKRVIRDLGLPTPDFFVVDRPGEIVTTLPFPLFVKPVAGGSSAGVSNRSRVETPDELNSLCADLIRQFQQPVIVERYLPGQEFTVGIVGTGTAARVLGVMEVRYSAIADPVGYTWGNKKHWEGRVYYRRAAGEIAREAGDLALRAWTGLGCRDSGRLDLRADENGRISFVEINPLAGIHPTMSDLTILCALHDVTYDDLLRMILESAAERIGDRHGPVPPVS